MINTENAAIHLNKLEFTTQEYEEHILNSNGSFLEVYEKIKENNKVPFLNLDITFDSDVWDLSPLVTTDSIEKHKLIFRFNDVPYEFKDFSKYYLYDVISSKKNKIQSFNCAFSDLKEFFRYLNLNFIPKISLLSDNIINDYISYLCNRKYNKDKNLNIVTIKVKKKNVRNFLKFYCSKIEELDFSNILNLLSSDQNEILKVNQHKEFNKTPNIPKDYFNKYMSTLIKVMNDVNADINERCTACIIIILSQTGLRVSELTSLKTNYISEVTILNGSKTAHFMKFISTKREKELNTFYEGKTFINELSYKAFNILKELYKDRRSKIKTEYLYCPDKCRRLPVRDQYLEDKLKFFSLKYHKDIECINNTNKYSELRTFSIACARERGYISKKNIEDLNDTDLISYITPHQFRVHLCTDLYYKNVPLPVIQYYMTHLSEDMTDYYIRRPERSSIENEYSKAILNTIIGEGVKPLGKNSEALTKKIDDFIKCGNFNIERDIDEIITKLQKRMPIKEKRGGICIKSGPKRDCSKDALTDEFYCAYDICPNHFHLYTMLDISYNDYKNLIKTMNHNNEKGFIRQAEREKNKLIYTIKTNLIPELQQLKEEIEKRGSADIINRHPHLEYFINNYAEIISEVKKWIQ